MELESENAKLKKRIAQLESGKTPPSSLGNSPARTMGTPTRNVTARKVFTEEFTQLGYLIEVKWLRSTT